MLGLPRIVCTANDLDTLFERLPSPANGITLCVGTYGSRPDNDLPAMARRFGPRIHFSHLRGVSRDHDEQRSFLEASHLRAKNRLQKVAWLSEPLIIIVKVSSPAACASAAF